ncbi:LolA family protein [Kordiimonas laminariae]|uniref:LolA family protein n=1 Tax=Kordiimonas laminariae TaxID=2917717 RepID=UPI001FF23BE4|nr:outer membrane lipoprotein carrier protein LolA [Kordiimonas laminariae]MCK0070167.1 outer membrane lipoprotein carrier protein LolA [Kordiimonas laminariae]
MLKALMFGVIALSAVPATAQDNSLPPLKEETVVEAPTLKALKLVQTFMDEVKSLKAHFVQMAPGGNRSEGTLYMARPGKVRFDYDGDIPFLVVADGKTVNFIDYEIGQVTKWPVKDTPLRALLGDSTDLASINAHIEYEPSGIEGLVALTAQDPDKPEIGRITVYFEEADVPGGLKLLSWGVVDAQGQLTTVELSKQEANLPIADKRWSFDDPRGVNKRRRNRR